MKMLKKGGTFFYVITLLICITLGVIISYGVYNLVKIEDRSENKNDDTLLNGKKIHRFNKTLEPIDNPSNEEIFYKGDEINPCNNHQCLIAILVEEDIKSSLKDYLNRFSSDIRTDTRYSVFLEYIPSEYEKEDIKKILKNYYRENNLIGVIFVGNIPYAKFTDDEEIIQNNQSVINKDKNENILSDYYYQDIYDNCRVTNKGAYSLYENSCVLKGVLKKPFWISRIQPPDNLDKVTYLKKYFEKNHAYRTKTSLNKKGLLIYAPLIEDNKKRVDIMAPHISRFLKNNIYEENEIDLLGDLNDPYIDKIKEQYEFAFTKAHGTSVSHQHWITSGSIIESNPLVYTITSCSVGNFSDPEYIVGHYLFKGDTQFIEACSIDHFDTYNLPEDYIIGLKRGLTIFEAQNLDFRESLCYIWFGDPTIKIKKSINDENPRISVNVTNIKIENLIVSTEPKPFAHLKIKNNGDKPLVIYSIVTKNSEGLYYYVSPNSEGSSVIDKIIHPGDYIEVALLLYTDELSRIQKENLRGSLFILSDDPHNPLVTIKYESLNR